MLQSSKQLSKTASEIALLLLQRLFCSLIYGSKQTDIPFHSWQLETSSRPNVYLHSQPVIPGKPTWISGYATGCT